MVEKHGGKIPIGILRVLVDGRRILRQMFRKWDFGTWTGLIWLRVGTGGGK